MAKKPGDSFAFVFQVFSGTGALVNADSLPTAGAIHNGVADGTVTVTVTNTSTGVYKATGSIPGGYASGDDFQVEISATVSSVASGGIKDYGTLDGQRVSDAYARIGAPAGASVAADIAAIPPALLKYDVGTVTGEAKFSPLNALRMIRNKLSISGSTLTVFKEDGSTPAYTNTLSTTAGVNPITGSTPD